MLVKCGTFELQRVRLPDSSHDREGKEHQFGANAASLRIVSCEPRETKRVFLAAPRTWPVAVGVQQATVRIARQADVDRVVVALFDARE
eukprot:8672621-Heterocapsa_arctica.AAC.1